MGYEAVVRANPQIRVGILLDPPEGLVQQVAGRLTAWNDEQAPALDAQRVFAVAGDDQRMVGGAIAWMYGGWCELDVLWVEEEQRGRGVGRRLLKVIETHVRARACVGVHTDTFSFQALPFYEKCGYQIFGQLEGYSDGNTRYYLKKQFP